MQHMVDHVEESIDEAGSWLSISDLMAALLMTFALLLVVTMVQLFEFQERSESNRIVIIEEIQRGLNRAGIESNVDLTTGSLSLSEGLNFSHNGYELNQSARLFLDTLIPIYSQAIFLNDQTSQEVLHLVIEGHAAQDEGSRTAIPLSLNRAEAVTRHIEGMIFPFKGRFIEKILPAARGNLDADESNETAGNRKVVFRFEFISHDLSELMSE